MVRSPIFETFSITCSLQSRTVVDAETFMLNKGCSTRVNFLSSLKSGSSSDDESYALALVLSL